MPAGSGPNTLSSAATLTKLRTVVSWSKEELYS